MGGTGYYTAIGGQPASVGGTTVASNTPTLEVTVAPQQTLASWSRSPLVLPEAAHARILQKPTHWVSVVGHCHQTLS